MSSSKRRLKQYENINAYENAEKLISKLDIESYAMPQSQYALRK